MGFDNPIMDAIDKGGGQECDVAGVIRELDRAGYLIVPKLATEHAVRAGAQVLAETAMIENKLPMPNWCGLARRLIETALAAPPPPLRCGDKVFHSPTGETWIVAFVDGDRLAWCGWPDGEAKVSDCTLVEAVDDAGHLRWLREIAQSKSGR